MGLKLLGFAAIGAMLSLGVAYPLELQDSAQITGVSHCNSIWFTIDLTDYSLTLKACTSFGGQNCISGLPTSTCKSWTNKYLFTWYMSSRPTWSALFGKEKSGYCYRNTAAPIPNCESVWTSNEETSVIEDDTHCFCVEDGKGLIENWTFSYFAIPMT
jgi:hypothetical protein